jgi:hypothetical protein
MPRGPYTQHVGDPPRRALARVLNRMRRDSALGRMVLLGTTAAVVAVITLATVILTIIALTSSTDTANRLAAVGDVLVGATLLLAAIAALVALLAYAVSTGLPNLKISIEFDFSKPNNPAFSAEWKSDERLTAFNSRQLRGKVSLRNDSGYSARNPAVVIWLRAMVYLPENHKTTISDTDPTSIFASPAGNWAVIDFIPQNGIDAVQWDGGPTYSIHGHSTRKLPDLRLDGLSAIRAWGVPVMMIEILAEGYRKEISIPVQFAVDGVSQFSQETHISNPDWM